MLGFIASLVVHALVGVGISIAYMREMDRRVEGRGAGAVARGRVEAERIVERGDLRDSQFGEAVGEGESINSLNLMEVFKGRIGPQDQAPLSRDPVGNGMMEESVMATALPKQAVVMAIPESIDPSRDESAPFGVGMVKEVGPKVVKRAPVKAEEVAAQTSAAQVPAQVQSSGARENSQGGAPGDPAPMSESESDAFSRMGTVEVRNGRVDARLGREFKSVRPRLSLKAQLDAISMQRPVVEMKVAIDETGKVIDVTILRSSGSNEIDLPTTKAMYGWWIEPAKNKEGKGVRDVILVRVSYL
jgi:TonB family protein